MGIGFDNIEITGWRAAIRGMRNPLNSWDKSDSIFSEYNGDCYEPIDILGSGIKLDEDNPAYNAFHFYIGPEDKKLMLKLVSSGSDHAKFRRMIIVQMDITAPLYWWKEFDTYKVGTVANSCSTMHTIHKRPFDIYDFSWEHLVDDDCYARVDKRTRHYPIDIFPPLKVLDLVIDSLNKARELYLETKDKKYWWQMIQLLPSSYNQKRTVTLNYEVLANIYKARKNHKLDEWRWFCVRVVECLPHSELITYPERFNEQYLYSDDNSLLKVITDENGKEIAQVEMNESED